MKTGPIGRPRVALLGAAFAVAVLGLAGCVYLGNVPPVASFTATPSSGPAPLHVVFDASASHDVDGAIVDYAWDFGDAQTASSAIATQTHDYTQTPAHTYPVILIVTDNAGATDTTVRNVSVTP